MEKKTYIFHATTDDLEDICFGVAKCVYPRRTKLWKTLERIFHEGGEYISIGYSLKEE